MAFVAGDLHHESKIAYFQQPQEILSQSVITANHQLAMVQPHGASLVEYFLNRLIGSYR